MKTTPFVQKKSCWLPQDTQGHQDLVSWKVASVQAAYLGFFETESGKRECGILWVVTESGKRECGILWVVTESSKRECGILWLVTESSKRECSIPLLIPKSRKRAQYGSVKQVEQLSNHCLVKMTSDLEMYGIALAQSQGIARLLVIFCRDNCQQLKLGLT